MKTLKTFEYKTVSASKFISKGTIKAENRSEAIATIKRRGNNVISCKSIK